MEDHAEVLRDRIWQRANWRDLVALLLIVAIILLIGSGTRQMLAPLSAAHQPEISLSPGALPNDAVRTTMRMLAALIASLLFTLTYGTLAAKSRRAEIVLIPLLDVLQSVPVLGYLSFTVVFFVSLFPAGRWEPSLPRSLRSSPAKPRISVQFFSVIAHDSARSRRGRPQLSILGLAAVLAARSAFRHARPGLEYDDVDVRRLVFRGRLGSHFGR